MIELTSFSNGSVGNTTVNLNGSETPTFIDFWVGPRSGTTEPENIYSFGYVDIPNGVSTWQSNLSDATHQQTKNGAGGSSTTPCLTHYAVVSGNIKKVIEMKLVSVGYGKFTVNLTVADATYAIYAKVYG